MRCSSSGDDDDEEFGEEFGATTDIIIVDTFINVYIKLFSRSIILYTLYYYVESV